MKLKLLELTSEEHNLCVDFNSKTNYENAYIIITEENDKRQFHKRTQEPCLGGLRKYKVTHGDEATDDHYKPGDLHHPFPKGEPVGLSMVFHRPYKYEGNKQVLQSLTPEFERIVSFLFSKNSPFIKGFLDPGVIELTRNSEGWLTGCLVLSTDGDPTTLVNLFRTIRTIPRATDNIKFLYDYGCTDHEVLLHCMNSYSTCDFDNQPNLAKYQSHTYVNNMNKFLPDKFKSGEVNLFTKGSFRERYDYSRAKVQDLFLSSDTKAFNLSQVFTNKLNEKRKNFPDRRVMELYAETLKEVTRGDTKEVVNSHLNTGSAING